MEKEHDRSYNCAESVLIRVNRDEPLPDYNSSCMKITSVLGGGIAGAGEVCGAISGAVVCIALQFGTTGTEPLDDFKAKRLQARDAINKLMSDFVNDWGSAQCRNLLAMDKGTVPQVGALRLDQTFGNHCEDYVNWAVKKTNEIRQSLSQ